MTVPRTEDAKPRRGGSLTSRLRGRLGVQGRSLTCRWDAQLDYGHAFVVANDHGGAGSRERTGWAPARNGEEFRGRWEVPDSHGLVAAGGQHQPPANHRLKAKAMKLWAGQGCQARQRIPKTGWFRYVLRACCTAGSASASAGPAQQRRRLLPVPLGQGVRPREPRQPLGARTIRAKATRPSLWALHALLHRRRGFWS